MFRRRKHEADDQVEQDQADQEPVASDEPVAAPPRPAGPWDVADAPDEPVNRVDLGGLLVPVPPGTEVRVDVDASNTVVAATLVQGDSTMQVSAFAAPRSYGIWDEVREEIATTLRGSGGQAQDVEGAFGPELLAAVPTEVPGQGIGLAPARFVGVDGPRWFLRALVTGPAATEREQASTLEAALRQVVVVRGTDPMAVRDPLPLRLPQELTERAEQAKADAEAAAAGEPTDAPAPLAPPERGPEITETR